MNAGALPKPQVVILAAGFSSRLGRPKALARVRSLSLLRRTIALAARFAPAKIIVVLPRRAARLRIEARGFKARGIEVVFAVNPRRAAGLSSSVRCGIVQARYSPALLLLPVDLASLHQRDMGRLISRWRANRRRVIARGIGRPGEPSPACAPSTGAPPASPASVRAPFDDAPSGGTLLGGVPLILPRWLYARALAVSGDIGLRELVNGLPAQQRVLLNLASAALDVDTPQDLRAARTLRRSGISF